MTVDSPRRMTVKIGISARRIASPFLDVPFLDVPFLGLLPLKAPLSGELSCSALSWGSSAADMVSCC